MKKTPIKELRENWTELRDFYVMHFSHTGDPYQEQMALFYEFLIVSGARA